MPVDAEVRGQLARRFEVLLPHLNEHQQRLALATEARLLGHGGVRAVAEATGVSATTVRKGVAELEAGEDSLPVGRARRAGGGRRRADDQDPELAAALLRLVEPDERGDPMSPGGAPATVGPHRSGGSAGAQVAPVQPDLQVLALEPPRAADGVDGPVERADLAQAGHLVRPTSITGTARFMACGWCGRSDDQGLVALWPPCFRVLCRVADPSVIVALGVSP
jgi:hypothetical protein